MSTIERKSWHVEPTEESSHDLGELLDWIVVEETDQGDAAYIVADAATQEEAAAIAAGLTRVQQAAEDRETFHAAHQ